MSEQTIPLAIKLEKITDALSELSKRFQKSFIKQFLNFVYDSNNCKKFSRFVRKHYLKFYCDGLVYRLTIDIDEEKRKQYQAILTNQTRYEQEKLLNEHKTRVFPDTTHLTTQVNLVKQIWDHLYMLNDFIGIQPMTGPVSLGYVIEFVTQKDKQMKLEVTSHPVEAGSRKLQAVVCTEALQDFTTLHGTGRGDFTQALSQEIASEIISEWIADLRAISTTYDAGLIEAMSATESNADRLARTINAQCNQIAMETRRGAGNVAVVSPMALTILQQTRYFKSSDHENGQFLFAKEAGTLSGVIKVYVQLNQPDDEILIGYCGTHGMADAPLMFCPYIPIMTGGPVADPNTFEPRLTFMTRYGKMKPEFQGEGFDASNYYTTIKLPDITLSDLLNIEETDD